MTRGKYERTDEWKRKHSEKMKHYWKDIVWREKTQEKMGGRKLTKEHREKISKAARKRIYSDDERRKRSETTKQLWLNPDFRKSVSESLKGENAPNWKGGISFEPYCPKFNDKKKEQVRNRDEHKCTLCGKSEILNGRRLDVHHIDNDKMQGCGGKRWHLVSLCKQCHSKRDNTKEFLIVANSKPYNEQLHK